MNENEYSNQQTGNFGFDGGYGAQPSPNPYGGQQYSAQPNANPYGGQQYGTQDSVPPGALYDGLKERLPDGMMDKLPQGINDKIEGAFSRAEEKLNNPYERVNTHAKTVNMPPAASITGAVIGFAGTPLCAIIYPPGILLALGVMFMIFGIGVVRDKNFLFRRDAKDTVLLGMGVFCVLTMIAYIIFKAAGSGESIAIFTMIAVGVGFILIGAAIMILDMISSDYKRKTCTQLVQSTCVYIRSKTESTSKGHRKTVYSPVFEFWFGGETYCVSEAYGNAGLPTLGERYDLHINPRTPTEFYRKSGKTDPGLIVVCIIFIAVGAFVLYWGFNGGFPAQ